MKAGLATLILIFSLQAQATLREVRCQRIFFEETHFEDVYEEIMSKGFSKQNGETFLEKNKENLVNYYIKLPKHKDNRTYLGLSASIGDIQEILNRGILPIFDTEEHDTNHSIKIAALRSLEPAEKPEPQFSVIIEINELLCVGCFKAIRHGSELFLRVEHRVPIRAIENMYILSTGLRPAYVPVDLSSVRANITDEEF